MNASFEPKKQEQGQYSPRNGSQSTKAYPSRTIVHAKLEMTEPGDHDEQEADAVATNIMSGGKISRKISNGASGSSGIAVSQQMESQLSHLQGNGRQMPEGLRNMMESGFGRDFSQVRLHTDGEAASLSSSIHAKAFTHGNDIYFNQGQFSPNTSEGQKLMAHELTHVVQGGGKVGRDFLAEEKKWHDENAVAIILDSLSDLDSIISTIIFGGDLKKIGVLTEKRIVLLEKAKTGLKMPEHKGFDRIDKIATIYSLFCRLIAIFRDIDMIMKDNKEYYVQLTLDLAYFYADAMTYPAIENKLVTKCPTLVLVNEALSGGLYIGDLINKYTGATDYLADVVFPFYHDLFFK